MAHAGVAVNDSQSPLRVIVAATIQRIGSQKAAAGDMGIDAAQLTRQLQNGHLTLERLEALGDVFCAELGRALLEEYGASVKSPKERAREQLPELVRAILEATA